MYAFSLNCEYIDIETRRDTQRHWRYGHLLMHGIMQQAQTHSGQQDLIRYFLVGNNRDVLNGIERDMTVELGVKAAGGPM